MSHKNILLITAHPKKESFTAAITDRLKERHGDALTHIDLYDPTYQQTFLVFDDAENNFPISEKTTMIQEMIAAADHLIFVFPTWWMAEPAVMKNFLDRNLTAGFAFRFKEGSMRQEKLLTGKTAALYITADGPSWFYALLGHPLKKIWKYGRLGFCGIKITQYKIFGSMYKSTPAKRAAWLENIS